MSIRSFDDFVAVPLPTELYQELLKRYPDRVSSLIEDVVWEFLERTEDDFEIPAGPSNGIFWGALFLPSGTELRVSYRNEYKYAKLVNDKIIYEGKDMPSVSQMTSVMRGNTSVNAWKHVEIKRPTDKTWILADIVRRG